MSRFLVRAANMALRNHLKGGGGRDLDITNIIAIISKNIITKKANTNLAGGGGILK